MKISVDVDCTPEELRAFLGLPDVKPLQDALMAKMQEQMLAAAGTMDPASLWAKWLPTGPQDLEQLQKMFWSRFGGAGGTPKNEP